MDGLGSCFDSASVLVYLVHSTHVMYARDDAVPNSGLTDFFKSVNGLDTYSDGCWDLTMFSGKSSVSDS